MESQSIEEKVLQALVTRRLQREFETLFRELGQVAQENGISMPQVRKLAFELVEKSVQALKVKYLK